MRLILLGPPGAGKGTVSGKLKQHDDSVHISTGDILRNTVKAGTELGKEAKAYMDQAAIWCPIADHGNGGRAPTGTRLRTKALFLTGFRARFPRQKCSDKLLAKISIKLDAVISLDIPRQVVLDRLDNAPHLHQCRLSDNL